VPEPAVRVRGGLGRHVPLVAGVRGGGAVSSLWGAAGRGLPVPGVRAPVAGAAGAGGVPALRRLVRGGPGAAKKSKISS
jgi:hypothetical protein